MQYVMGNMGVMIGGRGSYGGVNGSEQVVEPDLYALPPTAPPWRALEELVAVLEAKAAGVEALFKELYDALAKEHEELLARADRPYARR